MNDGKVLPVRYSLEIYEPGSAYDPWVNFLSNSPFLAISKGDIINPGTWDNSQSPMKVLKVLNVEHMIWEIENDHITHKLCVFTEEVEGTEELRK